MKHAQYLLQRSLEIMNLLETCLLVLLHSRFPLLSHTPSRPPYLSSINNNTIIASINTLFCDSPTCKRKKNSPYNIVFFTAHCLLCNFHTIAFRYDSGYRYQSGIENCTHGFLYFVQDHHLI